MVYKKSNWKWPNQQQTTIFFFFAKKLVMDWLTEFGFLVGGRSSIGLMGWTKIRPVIFFFIFFSHLYGLFLMTFQSGSHCKGVQIFEKAWKNGPKLGKLTCKICIQPISWLGSQNR